MILHYPLKNIQIPAPIAPHGGETYISQVFANYLNGYYAKYGYLGHNGLDIAAPLNTPIYACHDGWIVEQIGKGTGFGLRITQRIESDGKFYMSVYGHQDHFQANGEWPFDWNNKSHFVQAGELIGYVDSTGDSTGNHCHWGLYEVTANGQTLNTNNGYKGAINPVPFVKENVMEIYQVEGELTLVIKNLDGKFYYIATTPDLYPYVAEILGIKDKHFDPISKTIVEANLGGTAQAGLTFIKK